MLLEKKGGCIIQNDSDKCNKLFENIIKENIHIFIKNILSNINNNKYYTK